MNIYPLKRPWEKPHKQGNRYNKDPFYSSTAWRKARAAFLQSNPLCVHCLAKGVTTPATMVDHKERIKAGGDRLNPDNFQALCDHCHAVKSANESNERHNK
jgi:5-methylcytosine-specific restriction enzyme A